MNSDETSIPIDWNMVSPAGQAAAAAATTALLAAWLFMESQGTTQGSSSNDLVDTILRETNYYDPAEAGQYLAANTADILDHLNKPPAATSTPQPSAAVSGDSAGPESPTGDKPSSAYNGPISGITTEVFSGRDAFLILQALQIIPQEMTQDNLFEVKPGDLDYFLNSHEDGKPQRVILPNGNEVFVSLVRGVTFEDFQHDDTTNTSTIDFTRGIAIAVDVVKPGLPASTPGDTGDQPADTPGTGQDEASTSDDESESQMADEAAADDLTGTQETDEETADEPIEAQETDGETADGFPDDEAETGDTARIRTPEQDEAELDRFFGDTGRSDSQGQGMGGGSLESGGDQDFDEGTIGEEAGLEAGDAEGLASEAEDSEAAGSGALHRRTGADDIDDKIDSLFEELEARRRGEIKPPDSDSAGGGESGSSQAGIIDGDESGSAKDDF